MGTESKKNYDITCLVCKLRKTEFLEMHFLRMLTSRYFAGLLILTSDIDPEISDRYLQD